MTPKDDGNGKIDHGEDIGGSQGFQHLAFWIGQGWTGVGEFQGLQLGGLLRGEAQVAKGLLKYYATKNLLDFTALDLRLRRMLVEVAPSGWGPFGV